MEKSGESDILNWIELSLKEENFVKKEIVVTGVTGKTQGYTSDVVFAKVSGSDAAENEKEVGLAIKISKQSEILRKNLPTMKNYCIREINFYDIIFPAFQKFQKEKNVNEPFDAVPKCYKTFVTDSTEVLVLEDMRTLGYKLHERCVEMNRQHIELVLNNYAKFHAVSFAFQDQKPEEYKALTFNYIRHNIADTGDFRKSLEKCVSKVVQHLNETSRIDLVDPFEKTFENNYERPLEIMKSEVQHSVITHGDCHNNNFVFQYKDNDKDNPTRLAILDWQLSIQHSPVMDLSYFLYAVAGEHLYEIKDLLKFYHTSLTNYAKEMGTDLSVVYPFTSLLEDWRKYSFYGFSFITAILELLFVKEDDAPNLDEVQDGPDVTEQMFANLKLENPDEYRRRLIQIVDQYCNHRV